MLDALSKFSEDLDVLMDIGVVQAVFVIAVLYLLYRAGERAEKRQEELAKEAEERKREYISEITRDVFGRMSALAEYLEYNENISKADAAIEKVRERRARYDQIAESVSNNPTMQGEAQIDIGKIDFKHGDPVETFAAFLDDNHKRALISASDKPRPKDSEAWNKLPEGGFKDAYARKTRLLDELENQLREFTKRCKERRQSAKSRAVDNGR